MHGAMLRKAAWSFGRAAVWVVVSVCTAGLAVNAQTVSVNHTKGTAAKVQASPASMPLMKGYKKIAIGMAADEVESAWGKPKVEDETGFIYELSDSETAQIEIGPEKKVTAIAITFKGGKGAPTLAEVFGEGAVPDREQNGTVYKMVRFHDAGFWVSYFSGAGDEAATTLTFRKL